VGRDREVGVEGREIRRRVLRGEALAAAVAPGRLVEQIETADAAAVLAEAPDARALDADRGRGRLG
jgi:hypothetical protein